MLNQWRTENKGRVENIFSAIQNLVPSHLADTEQFDFSSLQGSSCDNQEANSRKNWLSN